VKRAAAESFPSVAVLDIESDGLGGAKSPMYCACLMFPLVGPEVVTLRVDNGGEALMVRRLIAGLTAETLVIGHNVMRFDLKMIDSRARRLRAGQLCRPGPLVADTYKWAKSTGLLARYVDKTGRHSYSLSAMCGFYRIRGADLSKIDVEDWDQEDANGDNGPQARKVALDTIVEHCLNDVRATWELYKKLREEPLCKPVIQRYGA
jgi:hypothetical protein